MPSLLRRSSSAYAFLLFVGACSGGGDGGHGDGTGGGPGSGTGGSGEMSGGSSTTGGAGTAGGSARGGAASGGATTGGGASTGGRSTTGGATGAVSSTGGSSAAGGSSGGKATGGAKAMGGASSGGTAPTGTGGSAGSTHTGIWKVMPLGDSVTDITCYAPVLSKLLKAGGHTNFEFVGTRTTNQACGADAPNVKMEGHSGYGVTYLPSNTTRETCTKSSGCGSYAELKTWAAEKPDIVLMHYGTNDLWDNQSPASIVAAYLSVIDEFRKQNENVVFFVSKIIKLHPSGCSYCLTNAATLAGLLTDNWASTNSTPTSPIHLVDDYNSGFDPDNKADTGDGVHPTLAGATKMATVTSQALIDRDYF